MSSLINEVPRVLLDDFLANRVIPFVGAGFSKNALIPQGLTVPDWKELGLNVSKYISGYEYTNPIDALSIFESQYSRVKLIELLAKELHVVDIKPGEVHRSFCSIFFEIICTTNFDFLLEQTLNESHRPYSTIVTEDRLPIATKEKTKLVKLHGDINHPDRMVITEQDYDCYLERNKVLSTFISNLFITRTLFLVGYSFDDNDIRSLWQIISNRLGQLHQPAYTVLVNPSSIEISRFERRNIKVISLRGKKSDYSTILNQFFQEIKKYIDTESPKTITTTNEKAREELVLSSENKRLCFLSAPNSRISFLKEMIYPILSQNGMTAITLDEVIMPGDNWMSKSETLARESSIAIVDASGNSSSVNWEMNVVRSLNKRLIVIVDNSQMNLIHMDVNNIDVLEYSMQGDNSKFVHNLSERLNSLVDSSNMTLEDEPTRLIKKGEYSAAIISVYRVLEITLRRYLFGSKMNISNSCLPPLSQMLNQLESMDLSIDLVNSVRHGLSIRNMIVHEHNTTIDRKAAREIVSSVMTLINQLGFLAS